MLTTQDFINARCDEAEDILIHGENDEFLQAELKDCIRVFREAASLETFDEQDRTLVKQTITNVFWFNSSETARHMGHTPKLLSGFFTLVGAASHMEDKISKSEIRGHALTPE